MPKTRIDGTTLVVGRTKVDLRFLRNFIKDRDGTTEAKVRVRCRGCRRSKTVERIGLRVTEEGPGTAVVDVQSNCHECRAIMNARKVAGG